MEAAFGRLPHGGCLKRGDIISNPGVVGGGTGLLLLTLPFRCHYSSPPSPKGYPLAAIDFDAKVIVSVIGN